MDKKIIIKYIEGKATKQEEEALLAWINLKVENREYFAALKDMYIFSSMPNNEATDDDMEIAEAIIKSVDNSNVNIIGRKKKNLNIAYFSVAAVIFIALCINIFMVSTANTNNDLNLSNRELLTDLPNNYLHTIYTNKGVKGEVLLPDGSKVKLNSDSKIIFPDKFNGASREVYLSGEAYFTVITNPDTPMIVSTNRNFLVKVYGTEFNIRSYENEHNAKTTLFKGKIDLISENTPNKRVLAILKPNESFVVRDAERPIHVMKADTLKQGAWRYGNLLFDLTPMDEVIRELERWHGAEFAVNDKSIYNLKFSASFKQESLVQILEIIKFCSNIDYQVNDNKVTLFYKK